MFGYAMQAAAVRITRLEMVSNVQKPAPTTNGLPANNSTNTNGVATTKSTVMVVGGENPAAGLQRKGGKIVKRVHRNGIVNGCSTEPGYRHLSPSPPPHMPGPQTPILLPLVHTPPSPRPPTTLTSNQTKTKGAHSSEQGSSMTSLGNQSEHRRLVCPELAINYTGTLMSNHAGQLVRSQRDLESRFSTITRKLREKQLRGVLSHARKQLHFQDKTTSCDKYKVGDLAGSLGSSKSDSLSSVASSNDARSDKAEPMDTLEGQQDVCEQALPIQVDGASDERLCLASHTEYQPIAGSNQGEELKSAYLATSDKDDVFREENVSFDSKSTSDHCAKESDGTGSFDGGVKCIEQQLLGLQSMMDEDVTDSSSDEEEEAPQITRWVINCNIISE